MTTMTSFVDEMTKISASMCASKGPKSRSGRRPIRAANLVKKSASPLASALTKAVGANKKELALMGVGAGGALLGKRGIENIQMAERMREMQNR